MLAAVCAASVFAKPTERTVPKMDIPTLPAHPRLLLTSQGISEMKQRIQNCDWARAQWDSIKQKADETLAKEIVLPPRGANWGHWYACPEHCCALQTGKQIGDWQWEHKCPVGGEILLGDPAIPSKDYDGCALSGIHGGWAKATMNLGLAYQMTGDIRYAKKSRDILLAYADKYLTYPLHNVRGEAKLGGGRVGSQNLDESVWLIQVCQGTDLIWDTLTKAEQDTIAGKMLLPAAKEVIMPNPYGVHNIQNWRNSAMGLVGFLVADSDLIRRAIDEPEAGFRAQMAKGVTPDGAWLEGAWGYHFYTMSAIWSLTEAARNCGIDLYCPEYKSMFDAPLTFAMPNLRLPAFNDSYEYNLSAGPGIYELAYARYKDPLCLELISRSDRTNDFALWFGQAKVPAPPKAHWQSENYPHSGYAILAKGVGEQATWLCMKHGPYGGGHGHPDKLSFVLYAKGQVFGFDPGTTRYGLPLHLGWCKTTLSHNTLSVDEEPQQKVEGRCIAFGTESGVDYAVCDAGPIYDGVRFTRTAALVDQNLVVFIDQIKADKEHLFDLAYHQVGTWNALPRGKKWNPPDKRSYNYLKDGTSRMTDNGITLNATAPHGLPVTIGMAGGEPVEVITATGVGTNITDRVPVVIFRTRARQATLAWFISLDGKPARIERLGVEGGVDVTAVSVTNAGGKTWDLVANPQRQSVRVLLPDGSEWRVNSTFAVK